jgi:2'-5' RNA ligase
MRLFTGIPVPDEILETLSRLLDHLRPRAHLNWTPVYNFHITTKFLGQVAEERLDELKAALVGLGKRPAIEIAVREIGWFPNPKFPRVLWAGVDGGEGLAQLAADTDAALEPLGFEKEKKKYSPHLTLARIKDAAIPLQSLRQTIAELKSDDFGVFTADRFHLYLSTPGPRGSIYTQLEKIHFSAK